jgi:FMN phosphatase YigB (HAD superfamily)
LTPQGSGSEGQIDLPPGMVDALLDRFAGREGYTLYEDVAPFFARMRKLRRSTRFDRVVLGVISNSDDRVPAVLRALGVRVGDMRADQDISSVELPGFEQRGGIEQDAGFSDVDLDLVITSYEAGEEKPNRLIFDVAKRQARLVVKNQVQTGSTSTLTGVDEMDDWVCVHVGDDYEKDYRAAIDAGWQSYLLPRDGQQHPAKTVHSLLDLLDELKIGSVEPGV